MVMVMVMASLEKRLGEDTVGNGSVDMTEEVDVGHEFRRIGTRLGLRWR